MCKKKKNLVWERDHGLTWTGQCWGLQWNRWWLFCTWSPVLRTLPRTLQLQWRQGLPARGHLPAASVCAKMRGKEERKNEEGIVLIVTNTLGIKASCFVYHLYVRGRGKWYKCIWIVGACWVSWLARYPKFRGVLRGSTVILFMFEKALSTIVKKLIPRPPPDSFPDFPPDSFSDSLWKGVWERVYILERGIAIKYSVDLIARVVWR